MEAIARAIEGDACTQAVRVLVVAASARGGIARHVVSLLTGLDSGGYDVGVACEAEGPVADAATELGMPLYRISFSPGGGPSGTALGALQVARASGTMQAQIIHTHSFRAGLLGALAKPLARPTWLVATIHNYPPGSQGMQARRARERWAVRLVLRRAARVIAVSEALRRELVALRPSLSERSLTIPNGVDTGAYAEIDARAAREALSLPGEGPLVGMIARLAPAKGIREFIQAGRLVADRRPDVRLVLAGDGPLWEEANALRQELGLADRLHLVGELASARELIGALDLLVVASTSEGSSVVAMEAMAAGKPVVATAVGGVPEVVADGESGLLVKPGDPAALADAIERMLGDREMASHMGEHGRRLAVTQFDVHQMVERTKAVYADLLRDEIEAEGEPP